MPFPQLNHAKIDTAPEGVPVYNPAFDNTPNRYITGIITEVGVCHRPFSKSLRNAVEKAAEQRKREAEEAKMAQKEEVALRVERPRKRR